MEQSKPTIVDLPSLRLMAVRALNDDGEAIRVAWQRLEEPLPSLRGRRFYGVCSVSDAETGMLGFQLLTVPAGKYVRVVLKDWSAHLNSIPEIVTRLEQDYAKALSDRSDAKHRDGDIVLAKAELVHADACRRAAWALRLRRPIGTPSQAPSTSLRGEGAKFFLRIETFCERRCL